MRPSSGLVLLVFVSSAHLAPRARRRLALVLGGNAKFRLEKTVSFSCNGSIALGCTDGNCLVNATAREITLQGHRKVLKSGGY